MFEDIPNIIRIFGLGAVAFIIAFIAAMPFRKLLQKFGFGKSIREGKTPVFTKLHKKKSGTPTGAGVIVWGTVLFLALVLALLAWLFPDTIWGHWNFLSRSQTWLPLGALVATAAIGLLDDYLNVKKIGPFGGGLRARYRLLLYTAIAAVGSWWFFVKLGFDVLHIPGIGDFSIGWLYIPLFILVIVSTANSVNLTDGLDGLSGGILAIAFVAFGVIAFAQERMDLAAFCAVIAGALLAFLWFNIHPAKFFMGDTGAISLGTTLGIVAMLTNSVLVLLIIGLPFVIESGSVILQVAWRKLFKKKLFRSAPIHHHFEAIGWPETQVTMRFWLLAAISAAIGLVIGLIGMGSV
ncbi:phospho-N-acetylmuramoyl-pentapeptide-transferase [Patescibacteria group bacterium]